MSLNNLQKVVSILTGPMQDLEDAAWDVLVSRSIDNGEGVQLDRIGEIVGQPRKGLIDADYKIRLRARVAANKSRGLLEDIINVTRLTVNDDALQVVNDWVGRASFITELRNTLPSSALTDVVIDFLLDAASDGVQPFVKWHTIAAAKRFRFSIGSFLTVALVGSETELSVKSTAGLPASGSLVLGAGTANEETVTYSGVTSTKFIGVSAVSNSHPVGAAVQVPPGSSEGYGRGRFSSVKSAPRSSFVYPTVNFLKAAAITIGLSTYSLTSVTPTSGALVVATIVSDGLDPSPTVTGCGLTWTLYDTVDMSNRRLHIYTANADPDNGGDAPSLGTISFAFGSAQTSAAYAAFEVKGVDTLDPITQYVENTASGTSITATMAAISSPAAPTVAIVAVNGDETFTPDVPFTEMWDVGTTANDLAMTGIEARNEDTPGASWGVSRSAAIAAFEFKPKEL